MDYYGGIWFKTKIDFNEKNNKNNVMQAIRFFLTAYFLIALEIYADDIVSNKESDHEKAIRAVNEGEILPLDEILTKVKTKYTGRIISINLKDSEKGLFGWVYDIMIIGIDNNVKQLRVDAGTSTILSVKSGGD